MGHSLPDLLDLNVATPAPNLNEGLDAATTQLLQGPPGSELGTAGFARPDAGDGQRLWNLAP